MPFFVVLPATLDKLRKNLKQRLLGRGVERQFFGASAPCSNPLAEEVNIFSSPALAGPTGNIEGLGPVGGWG